MTSFPHGIFVCPKYGIIQYKILGDFNSNSKKNHKRLTDLTILTFQTSESIKKSGNIKRQTINWKNICCICEKGLVL